MKTIRGHNILTHQIKVQLHSEKKKKTMITKSKINNRKIKLTNLFTKTHLKFLKYNKSKTFLRLRISYINHHQDSLTIKTICLNKIYIRVAI